MTLMKKSPIRLMLAFCLLAAASPSVLPAV